MTGQPAQAPGAVVVRRGDLRLWIARAVVVSWVVLSLAHFLLPATGLRAQYYGSPAWQGEPMRQQIDPEISTGQLWRGWGYVPPDVFSIRWSGYLTVDAAGTYTFTLNSDDESVLYVDRRPVIVTATAPSAGAGSRDAAEEGRSGPRSESGRVTLAPGSHAVLLEYAQRGGGYALEWRWARDEAAGGTVEPWRLSPRPHTLAVLWLSHAAGWLWPWWTLAAAIAAVFWAMERRVWPAAEGEPERARLRVGPALASLACCSVLAIAHTWPLASDPAHLSRNDNADTVLNEWAMAWVAHQVPRDPLHLFDANIFHPEPRTLAFSEPLVVQGLAAAPLLTLGASPVSAYNIVLLLGMALSAWAMSLVVWRWTGAWASGLVAGSIFAFNAHTLTRLPHIQAQHAEFLPLALWAFDLLLRQPAGAAATSRERRWSPVAWLAIAVALQALAGVYLFVFAVVALIIALLVRPEQWCGARFMAVMPRLAAAAVLAALVLVPLFVPYWQMRGAGFVRSLDEAGWFSASARDYVTTPSRWYAWAGGDNALFPGAAALLLAIVAVVSGRAVRDARARMCLAFGAVGVVFSFGPAVAPGYETLFRYFPLLQAVRTSSRFGYLGIASVSVLAGYGLAALRWAVERRLRRYATAMRVSLACACVAVIAVTVEPLAAPIELEPFTGIPALYRLPGERTDGVVVELPFPRPESIYLNADALLHATAHWRPLLNGYSGFVPPSYVARFEALRNFPDEAAMRALRAAHVTHVVVHRSGLAAAAQQQLDARADLRPLAVEGDTTLYLLADGAVTITTP